MRVYHDRLVSKEDKDLFIGNAATIANSFLPMGKQLQEQAEKESKEVEGE